MTQRPPFDPFLLEPGDRLTQIGVRDDYHQMLRTHPDGRQEDSMSLLLGQIPVRGAVRVAFPTRKKLKWADSVRFTTVQRLLDEGFSDVYDAEDHGLHV